MFEVTIKGNSIAELFKNATAIVGALAPTVPGAAAPLSATEQSRLRADATIVPPKELTAKEKKAAEKAAKEAAEKAAKEAAEENADDDALDESSADDDALDEGGEAEELTHEDVKNLLLEVRKAYPTKNAIISEIVKEHGKATKISEVDAKLLPKVAKAARDLLAKAKK
jgi:hypothetical protein